MLETLFRNLYPVPSQLQAFAEQLQETPERRKALKDGWMSWDSDMRLHALTLKTFTLNVLESIGASSDDLLTSLILRRLKTYLSTEAQFSSLYQSHMPSPTEVSKPHKEDYENPTVDAAVVNLSGTLFFQSINNLGARANRILRRQGYNINRSQTSVGEEVAIETTKGDYQLQFTKLVAEKRAAFLNLIPRNQDGKMVS
jgi:hypothetical protein